MRKYLAIMIAMTLAILSAGVFPVFAADKTVFTDQDFTALRSGYLKDRGGVESIGAVDEYNFRFWGADGLLANGGGYIVGYVTYKVSAPADQKIQTLKLDLVGRIGTYDGQDPDPEADGKILTAAEWAASGRYWIRIYVFKEAYSFDREKWTEYDNDVALMPTITPNPPSAAEEYSFDLSQWSQGGKDVYVTIATYMECTPSWIGFSHLTLSGTTAAAAVSTPDPTVTKAPASSAASSSAPASSAAVSSAAASSETVSGETSSEDSQTLSETPSEAGGSSETASEPDTAGSSAADESDASSGGASDEGGGSLWWILPAAAVVLAGAAAAVFLVRKKKKA